MHEYNRHEYRTWACGKRVENRGTSKWKGSGSGFQRCACIDWVVKRPTRSLCVGAVWCGLYLDDLTAESAIATMLRGKRGAMVVNIVALPVAAYLTEARV